MSRISWIIVALLICGGLFAVYRAKGSNQHLMPYFGRWKGGFEPESVLSGETEAGDLRRFRLEGYIQLYGTRMKCLVHLAGEQQEIDLTGTWKLENSSAVLTFSDIKINDFGGEQQRDPNRKYIPNEAVQAAYRKPMILKLSADKKTLEGLTISLGELVGKHAFVKDSP